jgi:predicted amidophosphoribosyltransferase
MRDALDRLRRWWRWLAAPTPVWPKCPYCGEQSALVERNFCSVCGRTWRTYDDDRRRLDRLMGGS